VASNAWAGQVDIVGVAWNGTESAMQDFVDRHGLTFTNLRDSSGEVFARFGVPVQPAWVFVDTEGTAALTIGALSSEQLDAELARLVPAG
jgi:peroxiredoxin